MLHRARLSLLALLALASGAAGCAGDTPAETATPEAAEAAAAAGPTWDVQKGDDEAYASGEIAEAPEAEDAPRVSAPAPEVRAPAGAIVDRDDHVDFALDFLGRQAYNSVDGFMELYGPRVRYFDRGVISRAQVAADKGNYFERWPNRYYELAGPVRATRGETPTIRFDYDFAVSHADASGETEGRAWTELGLTPAGDGYSYFITSERGGTY